jgi:hypothetical protein
MTPFFLSIFPAHFRLGDLSKAISQWISKAEQAKRWASERAAIKAEVTQAKETVDLLRMARAIARLDALDAEIDGVRGKPNLRKVPRLREKSPSGSLPKSEQVVARPSQIRTNRAIISLGLAQALVRIRGRWTSSRGKRAVARLAAAMRS